MINDANADRDAITGLRAPTNFGRPNWNAIFRSIRKIHAPGEGIFPYSHTKGRTDLTILPSWRVLLRAERVGEPTALEV
jgi:hypothetical protein